MSDESGYILVSTASSSSSIEILNPNENETIQYLDSYNIVENDKQRAYEYKCVVCCRIPLDIYFTNCGHLFCLSCLENMPPNSICPSLDETCGVIDMSVKIRDARSNRVVNKDTLLYCTFRDNGCGETKSVEDLADHVAHCNFQKQCMHCNEYMRFDQLDQHVLTTCVAITLDCENGCGNTISRRDMVEHYQNCSKEVDCRFQSVGCNAKLPRKEMAQHERDEITAHFLLSRSCAMKTLNELQSNLNVAKDNGDLANDMIMELVQKTDEIGQTLELFMTESKKWCDEKDKKLDEHSKMLIQMKECSNNTNYNGTMYWIIDNIKQRHTDAVKKGKQYVDSDVFYTGVPGYRIRARLFPNDQICDGRIADWMSVGIIIMDGPYNPALEWPFHYDVTFTLINQAGGTTHEVHPLYYGPKHMNIHRPNEQGENLQLGIHEFINLDRLFGRPNPFLKEDKIIVMIEVKSKQQCSTRYCSQCEKYHLKP